MDANLSPFQAFEAAVAKAGSQVAIARICGVGQPAISKLLSRRRPLPAEHVLTVEAATGVSRHDLRPDLYPREEASAHPAAAAGVARSGAPGSCERPLKLHLGEPVR